MLLPPLAGLGWLQASRFDEAAFHQRRGRLVATAVVPSPGAGSGRVVETVRATSDSGLAVTFTVLRSTGDEPRPLVLLLGGYRTGRDAALLVGEPGPIAVAALDYPYEGPERLRGLWPAVRAVPKIRRALADTPPAVALALDWLAAQPWVDAGRIEIVGVSLGVPFAATVAALDPRFRRVWLIHGAAGNRDWIENNLARRLPHPALRAPAAAVIHALAHGEALDAGTWAGRVAPREVVVVGAREDLRVPAPLVERLHESAGPASELLWTDGGHVDAAPHHTVPRLVEMLQRRLLEP